jgi:hypothetical protein
MTDEKEENNERLGLQEPRRQRDHRHTASIPSHPSVNGIAGGGHEPSGLTTFNLVIELEVGSWESEFTQADCQSFDRPGLPSLSMG